LFFLLIWIAFATIYVVKKPLAIVNPVFWMGIGWLLVAGLYFTSGYIYRYPPKLNGFVYFVFVYLGFAFGFSFGKRHIFVFGNNNSKRRRLMPSLTNTELNEFNYKIFFWIAFVGALLFLYDFLRHNSLTISNDLHTYSTITLIGVLGKIASYLGIIVWLYDINYSINNDTRVKLYAFLCGFMYLIPGLVTAGRQSVLIFLVSTIVVFVFSIRNNRHYRYIHALIFVGGAGAAVLLIYSTIVASSRTIVASKVALFEYIFNCRIPATTLEQLDNTGPLKTFFLEILSYYSHELPNFQVLFDNWDSGVFLGASQFQLISQNLPQSSHFSYATVWSSIESISSNAGIYSHTWRTISGSCLIDFGIVGGILYMWLCGYIASRIHSHALQNKSSMDVVLLALINAGSFFCIQFSPFAEVSWYYPIIWLVIAIPVIVQLLIRNKSAQQ